MTTLYSFVIPLPEEYDAMFQDLVRLLIIQFTIFVMYFISSNSVTFTSYAVMQLFTILGVCMYWMVFKKLVTVQFSHRESTKSADT